MVYRIRYILTGELVKHFVFSNRVDAMECIEFNCELFLNRDGGYFSDNDSDHFEVVEINNELIVDTGGNGKPK